MNRLEKRSFYSFLTLYVGSSLLFLTLAGFWYYTAQKNALQNSNYFQMQHFSDKVSAAIINSHMRGGGLHLPAQPPQTKLTLISTQNDVVYGEIPHGVKKFQNDFLELEKSSILISDAPQEHLNVKYVIVQSSAFHEELEALLANVILVMIVIVLAIILVAWILSKIFMRPIHQKVQQIEQFIQDISHELNSPVTALQMSSKRALQKKVYDEKILTNISISTKQLYSIYQSLAYINFSTPKTAPAQLDLQPLVEESIAYYSELSHAKKITFKSKLTSSMLLITADRAMLLFSNLISNAIKYSMPETTITLTLDKGYFSIEDEGVGIDNSKLDEIFKPYERSSDIAGGFGVGLSIVAQICNEFQIDISVNSKTGEGTTFTLSW